MFVKSMGDLAMPADFPVKPFEAVLETRRAHRESRPEAWGEFASGWNALCWRYRAAADHADAFTRSVQKDGPGPEPEARYRQEEHLFTFFVAGLSTLEAFAYGTWAMVWASGDAAFALSTEAKRRQVKLRTLDKRLVLHYPATPLADTVRKLVANAEFAKWTRLRNTLAHRGSPGRHHVLGGPTGWADVGIGDETTAPRRVWLAMTLGELLEAAVLFASERFD
jgi:hypothetical protein